jgi:6-phosphogluconolactonase (cycloisomerase 2 family)
MRRRQSHQFHTHYAANSADPASSNIACLRFGISLCFRNDSRVLVSSLNSDTGQLSAFTDTTPASLPSPIEAEVPPIASSSGKYLYTAGWGFSNNTIFPFKVTDQNGMLAAQSNYPAPFGGDPGIDTFVIDGTGKYLYASSLGYLTVPSLIIDGPSGSVRQGSVFTESSAVVNFHIQATDPAGKFLYAYATDQGGLKIFVYSIDPNTGAISPSPNSPILAVPISNSSSDGFGHAQLLMSPSGKYLYLYYVGAPQWLGPTLQNLYIFAVDGSTGNLTQTAASPFAVPGGDRFSMKFSPDGTLLYIPQRFWDNSTGIVTTDIAAFKVNQIDGTISQEPVSTAAPSGFPSFLLDPAGKVLLVGPAGTNYQTFWSFLVDPSTGTLTPAQGSPFFASNPNGISLNNNCVISRFP